MNAPDPVSISNARQSKFYEEHGREDAVPDEDDLK